MPAAHLSARFVTIDKRADSFRPAPKFVLRNPSCLADSMIYRARGAERVQQLQQSGYNDAQLYDPTETSVRGIHAFFLILGEPEAYGLPPKPQVPTIYLKSAWTSAFATAIASIIATLLAFAFFS